MLYYFIEEGPLVHYFEVFQWQCIIHNISKGDQRDGSLFISILSCVDTEWEIAIFIVKSGNHAFILTLTYTERIVREIVLSRPVIHTEG